MGVKTKRENKLLAAIGLLIIIILILLMYLLIGMVSEKPDIPSQVNSISPQGSISNPKASIYIEFKESMNINSVENAFSLKSDDNIIPGSFSWTDENNIGQNAVLNFTPTNQLLDNKEYTVTLDKSAMTVDGVHLDHSLTWKFYTPSLSRSLSVFLPIIFLAIAFLILIFLSKEYSCYRSWNELMKKRYAEDFDENDYDFLPLFHRKKKLEKGLKLLDGSWGILYGEGLKTNLIFQKHKSIMSEFTPYSDIEAIYPFSFGEVYSHSKKRMYDGIQIETKDLKICIFNSSIHPLKDQMPLLISELGSRWDKVYKKDEPIDKNMLGIHHWKPDEDQEEST